MAKRLSAIEAYVARRKNNHEVLSAIGERLKELGCEVWTSNPLTEENRNWFKVIKDDKTTSFGFGEVPYRWYYGNQKFGLLENSYECPFTAEDIIKYLEESKPAPLNDRKMTFGVRL